jgi:3'-phosphoadenosine 5'-phosphosulfate sulfotransferase
MSRSHSVDAGIHRRSNAFFNLSRVIRNIQNNDTDRLRWRRLFLNVETKLRKASSVYRERVAYKKVIPKLKIGSAIIFDIHRNLDRKDMMKQFSENIMRCIVKGDIHEAHLVVKAMEFLPKRK